MKRRRRQQPLTVLIVSHCARAPISIRIAPWTIRLGLAALAVVGSVVIFQVRQYVAERHQLERQLAALQREKWVDLSRRQQMERALQTQDAEVRALRQEVATLSWWMTDDVEAMAQDVEIFEDRLTSRVNDLEASALAEIGSYKTNTEARVGAFQANTIAQVEAFKAGTTARVDALIEAVTDEVTMTRATLAAIERVSEQVRALVGLEPTTTPTAIQSATANIGGPGLHASQSPGPDRAGHQIIYGVISPEITIESAEVRSLYELRALLPAKLAELQELKERVLKRLEVVDPERRTDPSSIEHELRLWDAAPKAWPTVREEITSGFGYRVVNGTRDFHTGIDIGVWYRTEVRAVKAGKVVKAGWLAGYGWTVEIQHDMGYSTLYGHLLRYYPNRGDTVEAGEVIGLSGGSGNTTGPHLHYEIRLNGTPLEPMRFLDMGQD